MVKYLNVIGISLICIISLSYCKEAECDVEKIKQEIYERIKKELTYDIILLKEEITNTIISKAKLNLISNEKIIDKDNEKLFLETTSNLSDISGITAIADSVVQIQNKINDHNSRLTNLENYTKNIYNELNNKSINIQSSLNILSNNLINNFVSKSEFGNHFESYLASLNLNYGKPTSYYSDGSYVETSLRHGYKTLRNGISLSIYYRP